MLLIHAVGILVLLVGLILFARSQIKGTADKTSSQASVWKINISGPPALILVMLGLAVFVFPFTPFFGPPDDPIETIPSTVPEVPTSTTEAPIVTSGTAPDETTTTEYVFPAAPYDYIVEDDQEICGGNSIEWFTDDIVNGWYIVVEVYNATSDTYLDSFELDSNATDRWYLGLPKLCEWEFFYDFPVSYEDGTYYILYVYSYDEFNYSEEPLVIAYP